MTTAINLLNHCIQTHRKDCLIFVVGSVQRAHTYIMLFKPEVEDAKGDANLHARGSTSLVAKEQM